MFYKIRLILYFTFIFLVLSLLATSCENKNSQNASAGFETFLSIAKSPAPAPKSPFISLPDRKLTNADKLPTPIEKQEKLFTDDNYLYYIENSSRLKRVGLKSHKIEDMFKVTPCAYKSGKYSRLSDSIYVFSASFNLQNRDDSAIVIYDMENKKEEILYHWAHVAPVSQAAATSDSNEIAILYLKNYGDEIVYNIDIIDVLSQTATTIISKIYNYASDSGERPVEKLFIVNDILIALNEKKEENQPSVFSIDEYDLDGNLLSSTEIDLENFLDLNAYFGHDFKDFISNFYKSGNKFVLVTQHQRVSIFEKNENSVKFMELPDDFLIPLNLAGSRQAALDKGYLFFATEDGGELFMIDVNKNLFYKQNIVHNIPSDDVAIMGLDTTRNGDLLILLTDFTKAAKDYTFYLPFEDFAGK